MGLFNRMKKNEKKIVKKDFRNTILGGQVGEGSRDYKKEIEAVPEEDRVSEVEYVNPFTGNKSIQVIDRRGTSDEKLALVFADKDSSEDLKLSTLSLYLFEKGRESASFIADLMLYKGTNTKEMRNFKSQMKFDFDLFINTFASFLFDSAEDTIRILLPGEYSVDVANKVYSKMKEMKENEEEIDLHTVISQMYIDRTKSDVALIAQSVRQVIAAQEYRKKLKDLATEREEARGKNVFVKDGQAYKERS